MNKDILKEVILEQKDLQKSLDLGVKRMALDSIKEYIDKPHVITISGMRRVGKSTLLAQIINSFYKRNMYYFSFEDERLLEFRSDDFNNLYEIFLEVEGENKVFFFDEIQNIPKWEVFVRRMQDKRYKFFITGSNASLLSRELGTRLTGRCIMFQLYPFSFAEFLNFNNYSLSKNTLSYTKERGKVKKFFNEYIQRGGMPEYLKYKDYSLLKRIYEDILYRDIVAKYDIKEVKALRELGLYLLSNIGGLFSYNNLKKILGLGSMNTVKNYINYLEDSFLIFTVNKFSYSLKKQFVANKKVYCIDNGIIEAVAFKFSKNRGQFLENLVFMELKRKYQEIYYYKTKDDLEVDFLIRDKDKNIILVQVSVELKNAKVKDREINSLLTAMNELNVKNALLLTFEHEEKIEIKDKAINIKPAYKWLIENAVSD